MEPLTIKEAMIIRKKMDEFILNNSAEKAISAYSEIKNHDDALAFMKQKGIIQKDKTEREKAMDKLIDIAYAINEGWKPDWSNEEQKKHFCWFKWDKKTSAFVFDGTLYDWSTTYTDVGSRLCFESSKKAEFFGRNFIDLHNIVLTK